MFIFCAAPRRLGCFFLIAEKYYPELKAIDFKISYWRHSNHDWELEKEKALLTGRPAPTYSWHNDYTNQTYWISVDINDLFKNKDWPYMFNIAFGVGLDDKQYLNSGKKTGGNNEIYIALDYNLSKLFKKHDSKTARKIKKWINYFKIPSPTIRIYPTAEFYPFFL